jgi:hypothetical protein
MVYPDGMPGEGGGSDDGSDGALLVAASARSPRRIASWAAEPVS